MADIPPRRPLGLRGSAIQSVGAFLSEKYQGACLSKTELTDRWPARFDVGWRLSLPTDDGGARVALVLADGGFPYEPLRLALAEPPSPLTWPHVETDGLLCLHQNDLEVPSENPVGVAEWLLKRASKFFEDNRQGHGSTDFRDEFLSYWSIAVSRSDTSEAFVSLVEPRGPSRQVAVWRGSGHRVVADDSESLMRWLERVTPSRERPRAKEVRNAVLLWLTEPLTPSEYPRTALDVLNLAAPLGGEETGKLVELVMSKPDSVEILLGMPGRNGVCFGLISVDHPRHAYRPRWRRDPPRDPLTAGFRPDRVPGRVLLSRYFSDGTKARKALVQRADHGWVHGRDQDTDQGRLRNKRVAIVGCGSLGGPLARLLVQAGIGNLILIDPDKMKWANLSRHILGAESVDENKAEALAENIQRAFPHLGVVSARPTKIDSMAEGLREEMAECDLIVEATGCWAVSNLVNDFQSTIPEFPAVVYSWMEREAAATHVVVPCLSSSCLRCGFGSDGNPRMAVTEWPDGAARIEQAECGGAFSPYGAVELCWAHALILETVVAALSEEVGVEHHRVWIGSRERVERSGGRWSDDWRKNVGDPGPGNVRICRRWPASSDCLVCQGRKGGRAA